MLKRPLILSSLLLVLAITALPAQEQTEAETAKQTVNEKKDNAEKKSVPTPDDFNPTEKISEDLPVAFPVDI